MASTSTNEDTGDLPLSNIQTTSKLSFHGAAANSCPHSLLWVRAPAAASAATESDNNDAPSTSSPSLKKSKLVDTVIYASSGVINLATSYSCISNNNVASVDATLVTRTLDHASAPTNNNEHFTKKVLLARGEAMEDAAAARSVTALAWVDNNNSNNSINKHGDDGYQQQTSKSSFGMVAAFSDGTVTSWRYNQHTHTWKEHVIVGHDPDNSTFSTKQTHQRHTQEGVDWSDLQESIADISATNITCNNGENIDSDGVYSSSWIVATASSKGIFLHESYVKNGEGGEEEETVVSRRIDHHAAASVQFQRTTTKVWDDGNGDDDTNNGECYLFAGSASPRHNKVWVYTIPIINGAVTNNDDGKAVLPLLRTVIGDPIYHGHLMGHQDWITCFSWLDNFPSNDNKGENRKESLLASSGHDAKIRLWKFSTWVSSSSVKDDIGVVPALEEVEVGSGSDDENSDEDEAIIDDLEEEEGEARLVVNHAASSSSGCATTVAATTAVSLEALLLGHEEPVTSLTWRRKQKSGDKPCLLSSSMDRTILLWMVEEDDEEESGGGNGGGGGVWVPISRVGSAGGILGGSIGASLMGFVDAVFSPEADRIVGHGYGGSIHFWTQDRSREENAMVVAEHEAADGMEEDALVTARWVADPCITGHFQSVVDMAWDPDGEYLLTTSSDQTTRLWSEVPTTSETTECRWIEVGRPQVHGYDMTSIVCVGGNSNDDNSNNTEGGGEPCHRFVSGADEKMLRVFDAPASTLRTLGSIHQSRIPAKGSADSPKDGSAENPSTSWRVERAFLPSLGLSNKATADVDQESSKFAGPTNNNDEFADTVEDGKSVELKLPSERDLGVTTLWPETAKFFGHESELVCLDAYRAQQSSSGSATAGSKTTLVASSCKARNDVASAAIRLWDSKKGTCVGILKGGHRSTVSTMSFSRDGKYLASSGKDRRICIWKRVNTDVSESGYELSAAVDSAHKRIVWSVHFCPKAPDILASGSRDGLVKLWRISEGADGSLETKELLRFEPMSKAGKNPVTAVAFADDLLKCSNGSDIDYGILSIGTESGRVEVWAVPIPSDTYTSSDSECIPNPVLLRAIPFNDGHFDTVKKVSWRPSTGHANGLNNDGGLMDLTLASCGQDHSVRIFNLVIRNII